MRPRPGYELPPDKERLHRKAVRLEWITIAYLVSAVTLMALVLGQSQAMKAAWLEDLLSLLPPIAFLIASRVRSRRPDARFPYGYHRAITIAYLIASAALLVMGFLIFADSLLGLLRLEHPSIGLVELFGQQIWLGWLMIPALLWSAIPAVVLGRLKLPVAAGLHDKVLYADAQMNKADWMTAGAAIVGVVGIGAGLWWADAVAAIVISLDIAHDGYGNVRTAVADLMDRRPMTYDHARPLELVDQVRHHVCGWPWVADGEVRLREEGHVITGEVFVVPKPGVSDVPALTTRAMADLEDLDWRLHEVAVVVVPQLAGTPAPVQHRAGT